MKINRTEFIISAMGPEQYPDDGLPEIALAGRSNVGKSSMINCLIQRKNLARRSATPGKTQSLNYYHINIASDVAPDLYFVDFPGYGYAKVSKGLREQWGKLIEHYLRHRLALKLVLLVVDLRHSPTQDDQAMYQWLEYYDIPRCVVATKADKISRNHWTKQRDNVRMKLQMNTNDPLVMFSSENAMGREQLWSIIEENVSSLK